MKSFIFLWWITIFLLAQSFTKKIKRESLFDAKNCVEKAFLHPTYAQFTPKTQKVMKNYANLSDETLLRISRVFYKFN